MELLQALELAIATEQARCPMTDAETRAFTLGFMKGVEWELKERVKALEVLNGR